MQRHLRNISVLILAFAWIGAASAAEIRWLDSLEEGLKAAKGTQGIIMVEAYTDT